MFSRLHHLPIIRQTEAAECGLACLAMVSSYHGHKIDLNTLRRRHPVSLKGVTLRNLTQIAGVMNLVCRPIKFELGDIRHLSLPAVLHWNMNHFVVLGRVRGKNIVIHDPATGERQMTLTEASKHITGVALELAPSPQFKKQDERSRLPLSTFWQQTGSVKHPLVQVLALSVILELLMIAAPFYLQITVDEVVARGDVDLLTVLAIGFALLTLITVAATALRSQIILMVQNALHLQYGGGLFHHLVRLPLAWFEKRHVGDILSRFGSLEPIRQLLAEGMIIAVVDGLMAVATLTMLFLYSAELGLVVLGALFLYVALRLALFQRLRQRSEDVIQARAQESSNFIETVRAMQTLKLFNREEEREGQWLNRFADVVNANVRLGRTRVTFQTLNGLIFGFENILIVYLAARQAVSNELSVGMIFAIMAYKTQFIAKATALVEKAIDLKLLGLHLERIADIALSTPEKAHEQLSSVSRPFSGQIELRDVSFKYSETDRPVLQNISFLIRPGEFVTISGPSGSGKSTLMKIMLGLLEPSTGEVLVDGVPLEQYGVRAYREQIASVMQDDQLLSGSISDNIAFFDAAFDLARVTACAAFAEVHDEISAMPMGYNSLVGDMGSSLSGGQKQRILLARALYRRPKILFLDEATAHLDVEKEQAINRSLRELGITLISIAHRPGMIDGTTRVINIGSKSGGVPPVHGTIETA